MSSPDSRADDSVPAARLILLDGPEPRGDTLESAAAKRFRSFSQASRSAVDRLLVVSRTLRAISEVQRQRAVRARRASTMLLRRKRRPLETVPQLHATGSRRRLLFKI